MGYKNNILEIENRFRVFCKNARCNVRVNEILRMGGTKLTRTHDFKFLPNLHASDSIYNGFVATVIYTCRVKIFFC